MPALIAAPMANDTRHAPAPAPPLNMRYVAIGNTLRWIQDGKKPVELVHDDAGEVWAIPGPLLRCLMARVEQAIAARVTAASAAG
jgi:hypothetical protein